MMDAQNLIDQEPPPPDILINLLLGTVSDPLLKLPILRASIELQVWAKIAAGSQTVNEIASVIGANPGGLRCLLDALVVMKLLQKDRAVYSLPDWTEVYLLPGKPAYLGDFIIEWLAWEGHGQLAGAIRTGKRPISVDVTRAESVGHFIPFYAVRALAPHRYIQRYAGYWQALQVEPREGLRVLDLACGAGIASHALALQNPAVRLTLQDWPAMLDLARQAARTLGLDRQINWLPGDLFSVELGQEKYDVARLGFVTYFFGADDLAKLFQRVFAALAPGGMLVIEASLSDENHCQNEDAVVDGPWLYAVSAKGDVYSYMDYKNLLEKAGFARITQVREDLIKAQK
jgi:SAM-dependent methyltransferase